MTALRKTIKNLADHPASKNYIIVTFAKCLTAPLRRLNLASHFLLVHARGQYICVLKTCNLSKPGVTLGLITR